MTPAALVLVCALELLGRSANQLPPIKIVDNPPPGASANAQGFVNRSEGVIYLIASASAFRAAEAVERANRSRTPCAERAALKMVASVIVHEEWHFNHGTDERAAYEAQISTLNRLGLGPGTGANVNVVRAMQQVIEKERRAKAAAASLLARRDTGPLVP